MAGRGPNGDARPQRRWVPRLEDLEPWVLLATEAGPPLGPYLAPVSIPPRLSSPARVLDPHVAVNRQLVARLGPELAAIEAEVEARETFENSSLSTRVLARPFVHNVLKREDTYRLLDSPALAGLIGTRQLGAEPGTATSSGGTGTGAGSTGGFGEFPDLVPTSTLTVRLVLPQEAIVVAGVAQSLVQVPPSGSSPGFFAQVPTSGIRVLGDGTVAVDVPVTAIPPGVPVPPSVVVPQGSLAQPYVETGPLLSEALRSSIHRLGPNAPMAVPGLRLVGELARDRSFSIHRQAARFFRIMRLAVDRGVFTLNAAQQDRVDAGVAQFAAAVAAVAAGGLFQPTVPPVAPPLPTGPLTGTLQVSAAAFRHLADVGPGLTGLPLPGVGNFPGRIDVGYIVDRHGNFGISLTARGPLIGNPPGLASANLIGGDLRVEVSNAPSLEALNTGQPKVVEGLILGSALSGGVEATNAGGIATFAASAGYGAGLEFGTGLRYTLVIPLGNVFRLIPSSP